MNGLMMLLEVNPSVFLKMNNLTIPKVDLINLIGTWRDNWTFKKNCFIFNVNKSTFSSLFYITDSPN